MSSPEELQSLFYNSPGLQPFNYYLTPTQGSQAPAVGSSAPSTGSGFGPSRLINDAFGRAYDMAVDAWNNQNPPPGNGGGSDSDALIQWLLSQDSGSGGSSGGGGGGGGSSYDPFAQGYYDIALGRFGLEQDRFGLDRDMFAADEEQRALNNMRWDAEFNYNAAMDDREWALDKGYFDLAVEKENAANYWKGKSLQAEMAMNAADNAARVQVAGIGAQAQVDSANISANAQMTSAQIAAAANRLDSYNRLQVGLAGAHNDAERNQIIARWNQEQANIAKMEDETRRLLGTQQNAIDLWRAETDRHNVSGQLAQRQNELIAQMASSPRDLFGLYFMQRGITPDWEALQRGEAATGTPLTVQNALTAYTPQNALPQITNENSMFDQVGQASSYTPAANPHLSGSLAKQMGETGKYSGGGGAVTSFSTGGGGYSGGASRYGGGAVTPGYGGFGGGGGGSISFADAPTIGANINIPPVDINPGGMYGGVPVARLQPGLNLSTVGGPDITGANFTMPAFWDQAMTRPIAPTDTVQSGTQVWVNNVPTHADGTNEVDYGIPRYATGTNNRVSTSALRRQSNNTSNVSAKLKSIPNGYTRAPMGVVGDARNANPRAGGAKPEVFLNPTRAPIQIVDTKSVDFGAPTAKGTNKRNVMDRMGMQTRTTGAMNALPEPFRNGMGNRVIEPINRNINADALAAREAALRLAMARGGYRAAGSRMAEPVRYNNPPMSINTMAGGTPNAQAAHQAAIAASQRQNDAVNALIAQAQNKMMGGGMPRFNEGTNAKNTGKAGSKAMSEVKGLPEEILKVINNPQLMSIIMKVFGQNVQGGGRPNEPQGIGMMSPDMMPRYATGTGTDVSQQYADMGMGQLYLQSSSNPHIQDPSTLPQWLKTLYDYGAPISPSLASSVTGQTAPTLNTGAAFTGRGGGTLPSLQTFAKQTKGETDLFRGYAEGPVGIAFTDIVDFLSKPTQNLQTAQRARGPVM